MKFKPESTPQENTQNEVLSFDEGVLVEPVGIARYYDLLDKHHDASTTDEKAEIMSKMEEVLASEENLKRAA